MAKKLREKDTAFLVSMLEFAEDGLSFSIELRTQRALQSLSMQLEIFRTVSDSDASKPVNFDYEINTSQLACKFNGDLEEVINFLYGVGFVSRQMYNFVIEREQHLQTSSDFSLVTAFYNLFTGNSRANDYKPLKNISNSSVGLGDSKL